jgi:hypothetical protein
MIRINLARNLTKKNTPQKSFAFVVCSILFFTIALLAILYAYQGLMKSIPSQKSMMPYHYIVHRTHSQDTVVADTGKKVSPLSTTQTTVPRDTLSVKKQAAPIVQQSTAAQIKSPVIQNKVPAQMPKPAVSAKSTPQPPVSISKIPAVQPIKPTLPAPVQKPQPDRPKVSEKNMSDVKAPASVKKVKSDTLSQQQSKGSLPKEILNELAFADNFFDMVNRVVPAGITLSKLYMDSCSTVRIEGSGMCKDPIREMFAAIKNEQVIIQKPPQTYIKADKKTNQYLFSVSCVARPGFSAEASPDFTIHPSIAHRTSVLRLFKKLAIKNHVVMHGALRLVTTENKNGIVHTAYTCSAKASYIDFSNFVQNIRDEKLPCAITGCVFDARYPSAIRITATLAVVSLR